MKTLALSIVAFALAVLPAFAQNAGKAAQRFKELDANGDGKLTADEVGKPKLFKALDADGNGEVTQDEAREQFKKFRESKKAGGAPPTPPPAPDDGGAMQPPGDTEMPGDEASGEAPAMTKSLAVRYAEIDGVEPNFLSLDVYAPAGDAPKPVLVFIHGGGWRGGDKANDGAGEPKAVPFVKAGYVFVTINYRLSPAEMHPAHVQDVAKALAWVHDKIAEYGGDPDRIAIMGHSAGAHLAALVATDEACLGETGKKLDIVKGVILLDGAGYDLAMQMADAPGPLAEIYKGAFGEDPATLKDASPLAHVASGKGIAPFLVFNIEGREDSGKQSNALADSLRAAGVAADVHEAIGKSHGTLNTDIGAPGDEPTRLILEFLTKLFPAAGEGGG